MQSPLFSFLQKYSPRAIRTPKEDYLTQAFCWVLNDIQEYRQAFLEYLYAKGLELDIDYADIDFVTQLTGEYGRYDMVILKGRNSAPIVIFEHKIEAPVSDGQVEKYKNVCPVVLITKYAGGKTGEAELELLWSDICDMTQSFLKNTQILDQKSRFLLQQLHDYFVDMGLSGVGEITLQSVYSYLPAKPLEGQLKKYLRNWISTDLRKKCHNIHNISPEPNTYKAGWIDDRWGRLGVDFYPQPWSPGLFAGILLDKEDHCIEFVTGDSVDVMVTLDFTPEERFEERKTFESSTKFIQLRQDLKNIEGYKCEFDCENHWRLLILRKPLTEVLIQGQKVEGSSYEAITEELENMINLICDKLCFWWE